MKYVVEMGSGAMIYITNFIKIGSGIQNLKKRGNSQTHREHGNLISLIWESKLKNLFVSSLAAT
jgi:hypothetical protein